MAYADMGWDAVWLDAADVVQLRMVPNCKWFYLSGLAP
jgi:hypothetical protein